VGARWGWVGSRVPYIALLRVAYMLDSVYSASNSVSFSAHISGLRYNESSSFGLIYVSSIHVPIANIICSSHLLCVHALIAITSLSY